MSTVVSVHNSSIVRYHRFYWDHSSRKGKIYFTDDNGRVIRMYKRCFEGKGVYFYSHSHVFPTLCIYPGGFVNQLYTFCQDIREKYTKKSIKKALSNCPNIYMLFKEGRFENCHVEEISVGGETKKLLAICYPSMFVTKRMMYNRLVTIEEQLKDEVSRINKYEFRGKWDTAKKIGANALKVAVKVGVAMAAGAIGANLDFDLPDFDFGAALPDIDFDFDLDTDFDIDSESIANVDDNSFAIGTTTQEINISQLPTDGSLSDPSSGYNISFQAQHETLSSDGGIKLDADITKEPGTSNHFCIKTDKGTVHNVKGGTGSVKINGIEYNLPTLKG